MRTLGKLAAILVPLMNGLFDVRIYDDKCALQAHYVVEQVYVNGQEAYADLFFPNGDRIHVPFKFGVRELQLEDQGFFRSYQYEDGKVSESKEPYCKGSI